MCVYGQTIRVKEETIMKGNSEFVWTKIALKDMLKIQMKKNNIVISILLTKKTRSAR